MAIVQTKYVYVRGIPGYLRDTLDDFEHNHVPFHVLVCHGDTKLKLLLHEPETRVRSCNYIRPRMEAVVLLRSK